MKPEKVGIKGPVGHANIGREDWPLPEVQEKYEANGVNADLVAGEPTQDPTSLRAPETDHTPNHTKGPKPDKPNYGKHEGRGNGGVGL
jgi:hypothetical protein